MKSKTKTRRCRVCKKHYLIRTFTKGCCSYDCETKRKKLKKENTRLHVNNGRYPNSFYTYKEYTRYDKIIWQELRQKIFKIYGKICMKCRSTKEIHVDHIKPVSRFPELKLEISNLQVLCKNCNLAKSYIGREDHRPFKIAKQSKEKIKLKPKTILIKSFNR